MKANWAANEASINSFVELTQVIESVRTSAQPTMIFLEADDGTTFVFGVGHAESVPTFVEPDGTSWHSLGEPYRKGHLLFLCRDEIDELMCEMAIPEADVIRAAEDFLATGERSPRVRWEGDW